tara:strand:- start:142 stop:1236 length:1095 start_codon:yes stop_codon:yes gene_type:complete
MYHINILTTGFASPNGIAFLFPFIVFERELREVGVRIRFFKKAGKPQLTDCDVLFVESRFFSHRWEREGDERVLTEISNLAAKVPLVWFDISDSTGWLQPQVLPFVRYYCKSQLYKDLTLYMRPQYGNRLWTDYYFHSGAVKDLSPAKPRIVTEQGALQKLRISWNSGIADYRLFGPQLMALRQFLPLNFLFQIPKQFTPPRKKRGLPKSCRMGLNYERDSVAYQRQEIQNILYSSMDTGKLSRRAYFAEMRNTRLVISPFGFGEITLKDFEATLCGAALLKPDMSHMVTWPNLFRKDETMISHAWDLSDFEEKCSEAIECPDKLVELATVAQHEYRKALGRDQSKTEFCSRVLSIINDTIPSN